jgi:hypothetical protein
MATVRLFDGLGGLALMLAAMIAIMVFALPVFEGRRAIWSWTVVLPLAVFGSALILYGRYWYVQALSNRKHQRTPCQIPARIVVSAELPSIQCIIVDISEGGARLSLTAPSSIDIPTNFELVIDGDPTKRACSVVWTTSNTLGVQFQASSFDPAIP